MEKDPDFDRAFWDRDLAQVRPPTAEELGQLAAVDWGQHGDMRGLTTAVERIVLGRESAESVIRQLERLGEPALEAVDHGSRLLARVLDRPANGESVARHLKAIQLMDRQALRELLTSDIGTRTRVARQLGLTETQVTNEMRQLDRNRSRSDAS
jgi:DNA-binding NtrC family response regulator